MNDGYGSHDDNPAEPAGSLLRSLVALSEIIKKVDFELETKGVKRSNASLLDRNQLSVLMHITSKKTSVVAAANDLGRTLGATKAVMQELVKRGLIEAEDPTTQFGYQTFMATERVWAIAAAIATQWEQEFRYALSSLSKADRAVLEGAAGALRALTVALGHTNPGPKPP